MTYLLLTVYEPDSEMNMSDQITVPADVWTALDRDHEGDGPIFVEVQGAVGRLRPAVPSEGLSGDSCRVPQWMWMQLGCPSGADEESWVELNVCALPQAATLVLRARREADLTEAEDPVAMLTAALSGAGGGLSWACLTAGAELPLVCGVFDVMEIRSVEDFAVPAGCILDCDVNLELVPALDHVEPEPVVASAHVVAVDASASLQPVTAPQQVTAPSSRNGFIAFSGVGRRLCD